MFHRLLKDLSSTQQGFIALVIGFILLFGALGKLGFLQQFLNVIMVCVGLYLFMWGMHKSNILQKIKGLKK